MLGNGFILLMSRACGRKVFALSFLCMFLFFFYFVLSFQSYF